MVHIPTPFYSWEFVTVTIKINRVREITYGVSSREDKESHVGPFFLESLHVFFCLCFYKCFVETNVIFKPSLY